MDSSVIGNTGDGIVDAVNALHAWLADVMSALVHTPWQQLATKTVTVVAVYAVVRLALAVVRRLLGRRVAAGGYLVRVVPPRSVDVSRSAEVWRLLSSLARRCRAGWRWPKPPLSVEIHADAGRLAWCLWVPAWVPVAALRADAQQAWPGSVVQSWQPDTAQDKQHQYAAGSWLAVNGTDHASVVRDGRVDSGAEPLRAVLSSLASDSGRAVLQVLVRPAGRLRMRALRRAAKGKPPRKPPALIAVDGALWLVVGLIQEVLSVLLPGPPRSGRSGYAPDVPAAPDPLQRQAMRDAQAKLSDRPHLEVSVRVLAFGSTRRKARTAARSVMDGFAVVGGDLSGARLSRPAAAVRDRWAGTRQWLLVTCTELGVLAHVPADPAWHGFATAALNRPIPQGARLVEPEKPRPDTAGWTRTGWTVPRPGPPQVQGLAQVDLWAREDAEEEEHYRQQQE